MKRVYEQPAPGPRRRVPGIHLEPLAAGGYKRTGTTGSLKGIAPSHELRKWFDHTPEKWEEFRERYRRELFGLDAVDEMLQMIHRHEKVTLVYDASKDRQHNSTMVLKDFLERLLDSSGK